MTTTAVRLAALEQTVSRLIDRRGVKVSDILKAARQRSQAGEVAPILADVGELEAEARLPGLRGAMAKARMRMVRGFDREALSAAMVAGKEAPALGAGCSSAPDEPGRSTGAVPHTVAGPSETVRRIDQLLAMGARS